MFTVGIKKRWGYLDNKAAFMAWQETGTLRKAMKKLEMDGFVNPKTGRGPTRQGVKVAAWYWVFENMDEARRFFDENNAKMGAEPMTDEEYFSVLADKAPEIYYKTPLKLRKFFESHPEVAKYAQVRP